MQAVIDWLVDNRKWVFSGVGVFVIGLIISIVKRKKNSDGDKITTHGNQSPGKVMGNYNASTHRERH